MSRKAALLTTADVPKYIREIVSRLRLSMDYAEGDNPGYTFKLYGKHKIGYEDQLVSDCEKLIKWCQSWYADAYIVSEHFWWNAVEQVPGGLFADKAHRRKAYRAGVRNYIKVVITDPVAHRFEKDGFYKNAA